MYKFIVLLILCTGIFYINAQDTTTDLNSDNYTGSSDKSADNTSDASNDAQKISPKEQMMLTLQFGIESEVVDILKDLGPSPSSDFYELLEERFNEATLTKTRIALTDYFSGCENLPDSIIDHLYSFTKDEPESNKLHSSLLFFLGKKGSVREGELLLERLEYHNKLIMNTASQALTKMENKDMIPLIVKRLEESETDDDKYLEPEIKGQLILALGKLEAVEAAEYLRNVTKESTNDRILIMYAMVSLAQIKDTKAIEIIKENLSNEDIRIREYAGYALSQFEDPLVLPILYKMLRHNNEKVRTNACKGIVLNHDLDSIKILNYKVKKDPSAMVRKEALISLIYLGPPGIKSVKAILKEEKLLQSSLYIISEAVTLKPDKEGVDFLLELYDKADEDNKIVIAKNVVRGTSNLLDPIIKLLLRSPDHLIRLGGLKAVYQIKDTTLWDIVKEMAVNDASEMVKKSAAKYVAIKDL